MFYIVYTPEYYQLKIFKEGVRGETQKAEFKFLVPTK